MRKKTTAIVFWITLLSTALIFNGMAIGQGKPPAKVQAPVKIELNKATPEQLSKCPGLTLALGKAIADYRSKSGPFKAPEDLLKVKGITKEILNKLNPKIEKDIIYVTPAASSSGDDEEEPSLKPSKC
jgi:competence ComEA-like helix-hairpin-helix protein